MTVTIRAIVHPTDFSDASTEAFIHALRIALTAKCPLTILHVAHAADAHESAWFPLVRKTLADWGLMSAQDPPSAIPAKLGIEVVKVEMQPQATVDAILRFLDKHPADLVVLATEGRQGVARWLHGSVAEKLARHAETPALFVPAKARGFVDPRRGEVHLRRVLIPVDHAPPPATAVEAIMAFAQRLNIEAEERLLHVGKRAPPVERDRRSLQVTKAQGDVVEANRRRQRLACRPDRHADGRASRLPRRAARLDHRARAAPGALPGAFGARLERLAVLLRLEADQQSPAAEFQHGALDHRWLLEH